MVDPETPDKNEKDDAATSLPPPPVRGAPTGPPVQEVHAESLVRAVRKLTVPPELPLGPEDLDMPTSPDIAVATFAHVVEAARRFPGWPEGTGVRVLGDSPLMKAVFSRATRVAESLYEPKKHAKRLLEQEEKRREKDKPEATGSAPAPPPPPIVLPRLPGPPIVGIDGPPGSGRRLLARALHSIGVALSREGKPEAESRAEREADWRRGLVVEYDAALAQLGRHPGLLRGASERDAQRALEEQHIADLFGGHGEVTRVQGNRGGIGALLRVAAGSGRGLLIVHNVEYLAAAAQVCLYDFLTGRTLEPNRFSRVGERVPDGVWPIAGMHGPRAIFGPTHDAAALPPHPDIVLAVLVTSRDFPDLVRSGQLIPRLWQLIDHHDRRLTIPRLAERKADIPALANLFTEQAAKRIGLPARPIAKGVAKKLSGFDWPENVAQLERACELAVRQALGGELETEDFLDL